MQRIQTEEDILAWKQSPGYRTFVGWIQRRAERIVGKEIVVGDAAEQGCSEVSPETRSGTLLTLDWI